MLFARHLAHRVHNRIQLAFTAAGTDDEIVGERALALQIEQDDVFGFLVFEGFDERAGEVNRFQSGFPLNGMGRILASPIQSGYQVGPRATSYTPNRPA